MKNLGIKKIILVLIAVGLFFLNHHSLWAADKTIKVGVTLGLTGREAYSAHMILKGIQLGVDEINEKGVLDKKIELIVHDSEETVEGTLKSYKFFRAQNIQIIIGPQFSTNALALLPYIEDEVSVVLPYATHSKLRETTKKVYRVCNDNKAMASALAKFAYEKFKPKKFAVFRNQSSGYSTDLSELLVAALKKMGIADVTYFDYIDEFDGFEKMTKQAASLKPDFVFIPGTTADSLEIVGGLKKQNYPGYILGGDSWGIVGVYRDIIKKVELLDDHVFVMTHWAEEMVSDKNHFIENFTKNYKDKPNAASALGYDSSKIVQMILLRDLKGDSVGGPLFAQGVFGPLDLTGQYKRDFAIFVLKPNGDLKYFQSIKP